MNSPTPLRLSVLDRGVLALATGLGAGFFPVAPGTVGSLWGPPLALGLQQLPPWVAAILSVMIMAIGFPLCGRAARILGQEDPGPVVWDEIAAFPFVFALVPVDSISAVAGFLWFRFFDVLKPWPCNQLEKLPGGAGIMCDDLMAGIYAGACLYGTMYLIR